MKVSYAILIYFFTIMPGIALRVSAQDDYIIRNYTDENGLPQNSVKQIVADPSGFIWLATEGGLVRYDGQTFRVYNKSGFGLKSDRFVDFTNTTPDGSLYAVAEFGKLVGIKTGVAGKGKLSAIRDLDLLNIGHAKGQKSGLPSRREILSLTDGAYKIIPADKGRYYLYFDQMITHFESGRVLNVQPFRGAMSFDIPQLLWMRQKPVSPQNRTLNIINFITLDGELFYRVSDLGSDFMKIGPTAASPRKLVTLTGDIVRNPGYKTGKNNVRVIWNKVNAQAFVYLDSHFYLLRYAGGQLTTQLILTGIDFDANYIRTAFYNESDGSIFLGSLTKGLFVITPKSFRTLQVPDEEGDNVFYALAPNGGSSIITPQGYLLEPGKAALKMSHLQDDNFTNKYTMLRDKTDHLWIIRKHAVVRLSADGQSIMGSWNMTEQPVKVYEGQDGGIWIGSRNGGVSYLPLQNRDSSLPVKIADIPKAEITWFLQEGREQIWVGTMNGLYILDIKSGRLTEVKGLEGSNIRCLYSSGPSQMWITTSGNGISLLEKGKLCRFPSDRNRYLDYAHCIVEDHAGHFWITTNKGLFQVRKKDMLDYAHQKLDDVFYFYYDRNEGFQTNEFNGGCQPCGLKIGDGNIAFPSLAGLVWFNPGQIRNPVLIQPFILEDLSINGTHVTSNDSVSLPYDFGRFDLKATTAYFGNSSNLHFSYNLGLAGEKKTEWLLSDRNQHISIYNLPAGDYILTVRKITGFANQMIEKQIFLHIARPWFLHWWFFCLTGLLLAAFVLWIVQWRTRYLNRQNQLLGQKVTDRTQELSATLEELKASEQKLSRQMQIQSTIIGVISHDIRSPLRHLTIGIKKLYQQTESEFPQFPYLNMGRSFYQSADRIFLLTEDLLKFIKVMRSEGDIVFENVLIDPILETKRNLFSEIAKENETTIIVNAQKNLMAYTSQQMLEIIIHNLLDNAVKSTFRDTITLSAEKSGEQICIAVSDTGDGMPQEIAEWLSDPALSEAGTISGSGFGLVVVKEVARMLGIGIKAESGETGTCIQLYLPDIT